MKIEVDDSAEKCIFCGSKANVIHYESDLWYVECSNKCCEKHQKYAYIGFRKPTAIEQWNYANRPLKNVSGRNKNENDNL